MFDVFMLPYGYHFGGRRGDNRNEETNFPLCHDCHLLVINQYFLSEMKVVENKTQICTERNSN